MNECKMVGYYHDFEDIKHLADKSADEIVEYMLCDLGHTYKMSGDDYGIACNGNEEDIKYTSNGKFAVEFDFNGSSLQYSDDDFINIYKVEDKLNN